MNWTTKRLKHTARVEYGLGQPPALSEAGIPILRATNITRGKITSDGLIYAAKADLPLDRAPLLREGEILVVRSGAYTGDSALVTNVWAGSAPGYDLRVTPVGAHPAYIAYCLLSKGALDQVDLAKSRAAQPHLNAEDLGDVTILLPSLDEQFRIANFLDAETTRIDQLMAARGTQVAKLGELWDSRLAAAINEQAQIHGWIPLRRLVTSVEQGWSPQCDDAIAEPNEWAVLKTSAVSSGEFIPMEHKRLPAEIEPDHRYQIRDGDILMTRGSGSPDHVGVVALAKTDKRLLLLSDLLYRIRLGRDWSPEFVALALRSRPVRGLMGLLFRGQSGQTIKLRTEDIRSLDIPAIPAALQPKVVAELSAERATIRNAGKSIEASLSLLAERRQALITAAVTGGVAV